MLNPKESRCEEIIEERWEHRRLQAQILMFLETEWDDPYIQEFPELLEFLEKEKIDYKKFYQSNEGSVIHTDYSIKNLREEYGYFVEWPYSYTYNETERVDKASYWYIELSGGGPADGIKHYVGSPTAEKPIATHYYFADWFDYAEIDVSHEKIINEIWYYMETYRINPGEN